MITRDKVRATFLGVAIGDALGMPVESMSYEEIRRRYNQLGSRINVYYPADSHKYHGNRPAGQWTDDTQLTLAVAESLIWCRGLDMDNMARAHITSYEQEGDLGFGGSTREAIQRLKAGVHWSGSGKSDNPKRGTGNGVIMKISPLTIYLLLEKSGDSIEKLVESPDDFHAIKDFTFMTHNTPLAFGASFGHVMACATFFMEDDLFADRMEAFVELAGSGSFFALDILGISNDKGIETLWNRLKLLPELCRGYRPVLQIIRSLDGGSCYVASSLPFSYAFFLQNPNSIESLYDVVSAGGDTDSNGSIVGSLLGALNGTKIFPQHLIDGLWQKDRILNTADRFCDTFGIQN